MAETPFEELKRYVRFGAEDEVRLRAFAPRVRERASPIAEAFYARVVEHEAARAVLSGAAQIARHKVSLCGWMQQTFEGPWDEAYYEQHLRIGRVHVEIALPHKYMFTAMHVLRAEFLRVAGGGEDAAALRLSIDKILDMELAIMLESYCESYVARVQHAERMERDDLQRRLALSEARYGEIVEKADALITTFGDDGCVLLFNAKCEQLSGLSRQQAQGLRWMDLFVPPADHALVDALHTATRAGKIVAPYEAHVPVVENGQCCVRWHFTTLPGGAEPALCAIGIDVTNEHELGVRTRRAERLAALGTMAAGLAHEIRNPLNSAHLQLMLAQRRLSRGEPDVKAAKVAVTVADTEMQRLGSLVDDFLQFARPQPLRLAPVDLRNTVELTAALLQPEAQSRGVQLIVQPGATVMSVVDGDKIKQVLLNLVRNALEATGAGGRVELSLSVLEETIELVVRDTGAGLDSDQPIFEPFFTTKEDGTGLGLAIVHRIVMDHGGQVSVRSSPGDTQFIITLPRLQPS